MRVAFPQQEVELPTATAMSHDFDAVYRANAQWVAAWAYRLGGPAMDLEDVIQEVFLTVHRELPRFEGTSHLRGWLFRITENTVRYRRRKDRFREWLKGSAEETAGELAASGVSPVEAMEQRQTQQRVYRALEAVPEKYRSTLILFELEGMSGEEISQLLGVKLATLWVWLHRARALFKNKYDELARQEER